MNLWTYSPEDVEILIGGIHSVRGYAQGTFVRVKKDVMPYETARCADGFVGRKYTNNTTYTVEITVQGGSPANNFFTKLWQLDEITQKGIFPILVKDTKGTGIFYSQSCWVEQIPDLTYSSESTDNTWVLRANQGIINIGGSHKVDSLAASAEIALSGLPLVQAVLDRLGIDV